MAISNEQYDAIMHKYEIRKNKNSAILEKRKSEVEEKIPRIGEIDKEIANISIETTKRMIDGDSNAHRNLLEEIEVLSNEKIMLLEKNGYKADYLLPVYTCKDCKDTGYIGREKCHCLKQEIINLLYDQSNLKNILHKENFDNFRFDYYSSEIYDENLDKNALENIEEVVDFCHRYIKSFDSECKNIFFYGNTGVGKTFLTNCIAKELIEKGKLVVYLSAIRLFELLADQNFNTKKFENVNDLVSRLFDCDLLIIDDLGTEFVNSFTVSALFNCINERMINSKSTIISSNLGLKEISNKYEERISSRIFGNYELLKIFGEDIRLESCR